jgi:hypothetical protein
MIFSKANKLKIILILTSDLWFIKDKLQARGVTSIGEKFCSCTWGGVLRSLCACFVSLPAINFVCAQKAKCSNPFCEKSKHVREG